MSAYRDVPVEGHCDQRLAIGSRTDCDHGVSFPTDRDAERAALTHLSAEEVRACFPRLSGTCPKRCGYYGIAYASTAHYVAGDW